METKFTKAFCDLLVRANCHVTPIVASAMQPPGIPDRYVMHHSFGGVWLEFKWAKGRLREDQRMWLQHAEKHCVPYLIVRGFRDRVVFENLSGVVGETAWPQHDAPQLRRILAAQFDNGN